MKKLGKYGLRNNFAKKNSWFWSSSAEISAVNCNPGGWKEHNSWRRYLWHIEEVFIFIKDIRQKGITGMSAFSIKILESK